MTRESWLNGWSRDGNTVLLGSSVHCVGCGKSYGTTCVVIPEGWAPPEKNPDWPFDEADCPVCSHHDRPLTVEGLAKLPLSLLRQAIEIRKQFARQEQGKEV
jgi:hypothetical protein